MKPKEPPPLSLAKSVAYPFISFSQQAVEQPHLPFTLPFSSATKNQDQPSFSLQPTTDLPHLHHCSPLTLLSQWSFPLLSRPTQPSLLQPTSSSGIFCPQPTDPSLSPSTDHKQHHRTASSPPTRERAGSFPIASDLRSPSPANNSPSSPNNGRTAAASNPFVSFNQRRRLVNCLPSTPKPPGIGVSVRVHRDPPPPDLPSEEGRSGHQKEKEPITDLKLKRTDPRKQI